MPKALPLGTVTFLFTDIEGSTRLLSELGESYPDLLAAHNEIMRRSISENGGVKVGTEGDALFAAFPSALGAVAASVQAQRELANTEWPTDESVRVRMGLHTGEARLGGDNYVGMDVNRAARIAAAGHGGQVLMSDATRAVVERQLPDGVMLRDLALHRLKDLPAPEHLWQLEIEGLPAAFPALRSLDARPTNLPVSPTALIGREAELEQIGQILGRSRLLTLTGPGGTGKTRLASAAASQMLTQFADGAFFVGLQDAHDRQTVTSEIAAQLDVRETKDRDLDAGIKRFLAEREMLLVLDNFEQVLEAAPLIAELLAGAPRLKVIVTSRASLHLSGEQEFVVPPLQLPDPQNLPPVAAMSQYEAVALFIERARSVKSDFAVTNENAPAVAEICSRLDGLPLAIELAAARVKVLTPEQILDRLGSRLSILTGGARDVPDRQRTLRGAIDWSHELLDEPERALFARLSVFAGGWTLDAADVVCNPAGELGIDTLEGMASLVDKSLVRPAETASAEPRFGMLQLIREFAGEKLEGRADAADVKRRHVQWMLALAEEAEPQLVRSDLRVWRERLSTEMENLRAAFRWVLDNDEAEMGLRIGGALARFWYFTAALREARRWLEAMLELPSAAPASLARAKGMVGLAGILYWQGEADRAQALYQEAISIYRSRGEEHLVAETLHASAWAAAAQNDFGAAIAYANEALDRYGAIGDRAGVVIVEAWLQTGSYMMNAGGTMEDALAATRKAIDIHHEMGRTYDVMDWSGTLAMIYQRAGQVEPAIQAFRNSLRAGYELGIQGLLPWLKVLADLELNRGHPERAARLAAIAERAVEDLGGGLTDAMTGVSNPLEDARAQLSEGQFTSAYEEGRRMKFEEAFAYALADSPT